LASTIGNRKIERRLVLGAISMPRKIRQLIGALTRAGFVNRGGRGSRHNFEHRVGSRITVE